jgi:acyl-CoA dehydrogenase
VSSPAGGAAEYLQDPSLRLVVDFFRSKGLESLKQEDRDESWYQGWIDYQSKHGLYASVLSPREYSRRGHHFNILKLTQLLETFAYFSPAHAYSLHVSFLGLFPILMSGNEALKKEAIAKLEAGGLFAFAVSEKAHGSDLFANEFTVKPAGAAGWVADGAKYYIGNANAACLMSILGKRGDADSAGTTKRAPFVAFALRPSESTAFQNVRKIRTLGIRTAFVGEFEVKGHRFPDSDIIACGRSAWDAIHSTVNFGKFFLGFGAVGICEHAFAEAYAHMRGRVLYGKPVTQMPHIRALTANAYARLVAMKLYAYRALDYLQACCAADRRYLLFNAVQKAKVSTEGVKVVGLLSECIGARGVEADTYFESALRDAQLIPGLEGSTHINFGLTAQFLNTYFAASSDEVRSPPSLMLEEVAPEENPYWIDTRDRNAKTVSFAHFLNAYEPLFAVTNVDVFMEQVKAFRQFVAGAATAMSPPADAGFFIAIGKCLSTCAYAQLVAENCLAAAVAPALVSLIFHGLIEDLGAEALKVTAMFVSGSASRALLKQVLRVPRTSAADLESVSDLIASRYKV